jgi:septal ring factor EnvC (AmiA/AmiB activator)
VALILSLQKKLADAEKNRDLLSSRILQQSNNVSSITQKIDMLNADNVRLNNQINAINTNKTAL